MRVPLYFAVIGVIVGSLNTAIVFAETPNIDPPHDMSGAAMSDDMGRDDKGDMDPAAEDSDAQAAASSNDLVVQVNGIVCSFCAHGLEKALSKLEGLDTSRYGNGVLVNIEDQLVTLVFVSGESFQFGEVHRRIKKAGYDPVRFDFQLVGRLDKDADGWSVENSVSHADYRLDAGDVTRLAMAEGARIDQPVYLEAAQTSTLESEQPVHVHLNAKE